ncbi:MAG: zinc-ribbon domain-containing protein [Promethearchaeota archaeon]|nr:MAG: zinc-ribbon domain-containing protein [Candidatus Lokiarchaeota archaeon]
MTRDRHLERRSPTGYCPICKQEVLLTREDINWGVAILLLCFTGGIGLIIYLVIYYSKPEDRCIHCNNRVISRAAQSSHVVELVGPVLNQNDKVLENEEPKYCVFCGEQLESSNVRYCPHCGSKV